MRRWEKVLFGFSIVTIIGITALGIWQRDNIEAGFMVLTKSTDQIAVQMNDNKKELETELKKKYPTIISDFTAEEERMIIKGELSVDEAIALIQEKYNKAKAELNGQTYENGSEGILNNNSVGNDERLSINDNVGHSGADNKNVGNYGNSYNNSVSSENLASVDGNSSVDNEAAIKENSNTAKANGGNASNSSNENSGVSGNVDKNVNTVVASQNTSGTDKNGISNNNQNIVVNNNNYGNTNNITSKNDNRIGTSSGTGSSNVIAGRNDGKNTDSSRNNGSRNNSTSKDKNNSASSEDIDYIIGDKIVELYSLKAYYLGQIGQLEASAKNDFYSLPKKQRNLVNKQAVIGEYTSIALGHLSACDSKVNAILQELESDLKNANADTSIIKTIRDAYENEKTMKKAYYVTLLNE